MERFFENVKSFFMTSGMLILECAVILVLGFIAVSTLTKIVKRALLLSKIDNMVISLILKILEFGLKVVIVVYVLTRFKVPLTSIVVIFSTISLAVGLAIQDWLGNFANGIVLIATKPFKVGDFVKIGTGDSDKEGYIRQIRFMTTEMDTVDNKRLLIPNKTVFNSEITNYSANSTRMVELEFCVDYDTDINLAKKIISETALDNEKILHIPAPLIRLIKQDESSLNIRTRVWTAAENYFEILYYMNEQVLENFRANGIEIPFNQMVISYREKSKNNSKKNKEIIITTPPIQEKAIGIEGDENSED